MVQDFLEDVGPLVGMQLGGAALDGLGDIFDRYIDMLINALPGQELEEEQRRKVLQFADARVLNVLSKWIGSGFLLVVGWQV